MKFSSSSRLRNSLSLWNLPGLISISSSTEPMELFLSYANRCNPFHQTQGQHRQCKQSLSPCQRLSTKDLRTAKLSILIVSLVHSQKSMTIALTILYCKNLTIWLTSPFRYITMSASSGTMTSVVHCPKKIETRLRYTTLAHSLPPRNPLGVSCELAHFATCASVIRGFMQSQINHRTNSNTYKTIARTRF